MTRILTALVGIPIIFVIVKFLPPEALVVCVAACVVLGCLELFAIAEAQGYRPHKLLGAALGVGAACSFYSGKVSVTQVLCATAILVPLASLLRAARGAGPLDGELAGIGVTFAGVLFVGWLMGYCIGLMGDGAERGRDLTVFLFFVVWLSDAGAYVVGSLWGKRKLAARISPGKTVEGVLGALAVAVAAAFVARAWFFRSLGVGDALALGVLLGGSGVLGDLSESMLKRTAAIKDSGRLFPGHGGMLDRADSLLFAGPALFYYHNYMLG